MKALSIKIFFILGLLILGCDEESNELQCNTYYIKSSTSVTSIGKPISTYLYNSQGKLSKTLDNNGNIINQYFYEENKLVQVDGDQVRWEFSYDVNGRVKYANSYIYDFNVPHDSLTFEYNASGQVVKQSHHNLNSLSGTYEFTLWRYAQFQYTNGVSQKTFTTNASIYPAFEQLFTRNFTFDNKQRVGHPELFFYHDASAENPSSVNNEITLEYIPQTGAVSSYNRKYEYNHDGYVTKSYFENILMTTFEYSCDPILE